MRVWAFASCGTLVALAACTANQTTSQNAPKGVPAKDDSVSLNQVSPLDSATSLNPKAVNPVAPPEVGNSRNYIPTARQPGSSSLDALLERRLQQIRASQTSS